MSAQSSVVESNLLLSDRQGGGQGMASPLSSGNLSPSTQGVAAPTSAKAKRSAEEKRRREEAELRLLIQQEMESARLLHARILQNEAQLAALAKQLDKQTDATETERRALVSEVKKWEKRLKLRQETVAEKRQEVQEIDSRIHNLKNQKNVQKICLASLFLRYDMKPDIAVDPEEIYAPRPPSGSVHHKKSFNKHASNATAAALPSTDGGEDTAAPTTPPPEEELPKDDDKLTENRSFSDGSPLGAKRRSRAGSKAGLNRRTSSVVVKELELEAGLEYLRPRLHQVQHDTLNERSAFTQSVRTELQELYGELASMGETM